MAQRLADRLSRARESQFVGRMAELALFRSALTAPDPPFYVLYLYGPGGVGKTTLVRKFVSLCEELGVMPIYIDARDVEPAPEAFLGALRLALGTDASVSPIQFLADREGRQVILIDTSEVLLPIDYWLSNVFLPQLTDNTMIVLAGRHQPSPSWYADPGWRSLIRVVPLRNLSPDESSVFLEKRGIPGDQLGRVLEFTHLFRPGSGARHHPFAPAAARAQGAWPGLSRHPGGLCPGAGHDRAAAGRHAGLAGCARPLRLAARVVGHRGRTRGSLPARPGARGPGDRFALAQSGLV